MANSSSTGTSKSNCNEVRSGHGGCNSANKMSILRKMDVDYPNGRILTTPSLKIFTLSELKSATSKFRHDAIIGGGEFGTVFKGGLDEKTLAPAKPGTGMVTAIEKLNPKRERGIREWQSEIEFLGRLSHPNLVKLLGYCLDEKEILLVYEFMAEGSLEQHLFKKVSHPLSDPLSWSTRLKILIGAARGIAFLHSSNKQVIYRDFKASNILLDSNYNAKLSDFGLVKNGPSAVGFHFLDPGLVCMAHLETDGYAAVEFVATGRVMGTFGYDAPEDVETGDLYGKSDVVYGFGGVLLEMLTRLRAPDFISPSGQRNLKKLVELTGLRVLDDSRPSGLQNLVEWTRPLLSNRLERFMDKRLEGQYPPEAALKAAQLSLKCLDNDPRSRPSMKEVVDALEQIEAIKQKPRAAKPKTAAPPANHRLPRWFRVTFLVSCFCQWFRVSI